MKNILKHLKSFAVIVPLCVLLILTQAFCELSIPNLWGGIIDVGLRQSGLGAGAPEAMSRRGMELLQVFMTDSDREFIEGVYYTFEPESSEAARVAAQYPLALEESVCVMRADVWGITRARADSVYANAARSLELYLEQESSRDELENLRKKYETAKKQAEQGVLKDPSDASGEGVIGKIPDGAVIAGIDGMSAGEEPEPEMMSAETGSNLMETQQAVYGIESLEESSKESIVPEHELLDRALDEAKNDPSGEQEAQNNEDTSKSLNDYYDILPLLQALPDESKQEAISRARTDASTERVGSTFKKLFYEELGVNVAPIRSTYMRRTIIKLVAAAILCIAALVLSCVLAQKLSEAVGKKLLESLESRVESFEEESRIHLIARAANDIRGVQSLTDLVLRLALYVPAVLIGGAVLGVKNSLSGVYTAILVVLLILIAAVLTLVIFFRRLSENAALSEKLKLSGLEKLIKKLPDKLLSGEQGALSRKWLLKLATLGAVTAVTLLLSLFCAVAVPAASEAVEGAVIELGRLTAFVQYILQLIAVLVPAVLLITALRSSFPAILRIKEALFPQRGRREKGKS